MVAIKFFLGFAIILIPILIILIGLGYSGMTNEYLFSLFLTFPLLNISMSGISYLTSINASDNRLLYRSIFKLICINSALSIAVLIILGIVATYQEKRILDFSQFALFYTIYVGIVFLISFSHPFRNSKQ